VKGKPSVGKRTLIMLASWLEEWNLTIDEIFDLYRTNTIDSDEFIQKVVQSNLKMKLKLWEEYALVNVLDLDKDGFITWFDCWSLILAG